MNVFVVYCHPSDDSFTGNVKKEFLRGLSDAGHSYILSDLYQMNFNETFSKAEYQRDAYYRDELPIAADVLAEQEKLSASDAVVFIYPVFWTEAPAKLVGWFQRVWSYGFAYGEHRRMKPLEKALFLVTMGGSLEDPIRQEQAEAMRTVMLGDRIYDRAKEKQMIFFDEMTRGYGNDEKRAYNERLFLRQVYELGRGFGE